MKILDSDDKHEFGGAWTQIKLEILKSYLVAYTIALRKQQFKLAYIDAFAGTGRCEVKTNLGSRTVDGSARIALEVQPGFDQYYFIEKEGKKVAALEDLKAGYRDKDIAIVHGDANGTLKQLFQTSNWINRRGVLFLDPFGMHLKWAVLEAAARTKALDVWYLFPISALVRQAANDAAKLEAYKADSINRILGTDTWRNAFYAKNPQQDLFGATPSDQRMFNTEQILDYFHKRLLTVFPFVAKPKELKLGTVRNQNGGPALFALYFAVSNPNKSANGLAAKIANHILDKL